MFPVIQTIIYTFYFTLFLSEAVSENATAPCYHTEANARYKEINESFVTKSPVPVKIRRETKNSTEKDSILIITEPSGLKGIKEDAEMSREKESLITTQYPEQLKQEETNVTILTNFKNNKEIEIKNFTEKGSPEPDFTNCTEIPIRSTNSKDIINGKGDLRGLGTLGTNNTESAHTFAITISFNTATPNKEAEGSLKKAFFIVMNLNPENSSTEERNSTEKPLMTTIPPDIDTTKEDGYSTQEEPEEKNPTDFAQTSSKENNQSKINTRQVRNSETEWATIGAFESENLESEDGSEKQRAQKAFLLTFKKCNIINGKYLLRAKVGNIEEVRKCIKNELRNIESYPDQYIKYLKNSEISKQD